ncbi:MAG: phage tail length tape measure family protein [Chelatococcus sp.]|uniref:phage tail length tape measure family protein n=1 Tax=Chelatococcus sp. TaxID=1953771 RepID=UPI0025BE5B81|nr:phage tail length tape measure family protein [Chelatococcus sp.]MBX3537678.1 phage tail length tape measure family protein [Chelatococcus sp.]
MDKLVSSLADLGSTAVEALGSYSRSQEAFQQALKGVGAASGATIADLNKVAEAGAKAGKISAESAREMAAEYVSTGKIGSDTMEGLIAITGRFAKTMNIDAAEATKMLGKAFSDPVRGADELNERLGFLDDRTREHIRGLMDQNQEVAAQRALIDALGPSIDDAATKTRGLAGAWDAVKSAARGAIVAMGEAVSKQFEGVPRAERILQIQQQLKRIQEGSLPTIDGSDPAPIVKSLNAELLKLQMSEAYSRLGADMRAAAQDANGASIEVGKLVSAVNPAQAKLDQLKAQQADIQRVLKSIDNPDRFDTSVTGYGATRVKDINALRDASERYSYAIKSLTGANGKAITAEELRSKQEKLSLQIMQAKTPEIKAALVAEKAMLETSGELITQSEAQTRGENAAALARQQAANATAKASGAANDNRSAIDGLIQSTDMRIDQLKLEAQGYGRSSEEILRLRAAHQLLKAEQRDGKSATDAQRQSYEQQTQDLIRWTKATEDSQRATRALNDAQQFLGDNLSAFVEDLVSGTGSLDDALRNLGDVFLRSGLQALLTGEGPLAGILGTSATERGKQGGILGMLAGNELSAFRKVVTEGTSDGVAKAIGSGGSTSTNAVGNIFGVDGKMLAGGVTALASLGAAFGSGMSAGSPAMGAATGALSGAMGGAMLGNMILPGVGAIIGAIGGALAGGGAGPVGGNQQSSKERKHVRSEYRREFAARMAA